MKQSSLEERFRDQVARYRLPEPIYEYRFAKIVGRQHRFDACWPTYHLGVELQGFNVESVKLARGHHQRVVTSGHFSVGQIAEDCDKLNMAILLGWSVLQFTESHLKADQAMPVLQRVLVARGWDGMLAPLQPMQAELAVDPF
ncbi:hypothetical protein [Bradyrhizobium sp.]|uniref:hypothetical protein n=1 Tax=Bradyrhizobium sp. TaxID=376 RepID=UPI003C485657